MYRQVPIERKELITAFYCAIEFRFADRLHPEYMTTTGSRVSGLLSRVAYSWKWEKKGCLPYYYFETWDGTTVMFW